MRLHLVEAHIALEKGVLLLAAERISDLTRPQIEEALDAYLHADPYAESQAVPQQGKGAESHDRLHLALAEATGNPILVQLERTLLDMVPMSLRVRGFLDGAPADNPRRIEAEREIHTGLCSAVMAGDAQSALQWLSRHDEFERGMIESLYP